MFKFRKKIFSAVLFLLLATPLFTNAAGLIPCGGKEDPCTLCHLVVGFHGLIKYGMSIIIVVAITGITIAGVMYVISAGDQKMMEQAKSFLKASLYGFAFVFLGWLIVSITMFLLSAKDSNGDKIPDFGIASTGSWNKFTCSTASSSGQTSGTTNKNPNAGGSPNKYVCDSINVGGTIETKCNVSATGSYSSLSDCNAACGVPAQGTPCNSAGGYCANPDLGGQPCPETFRQISGTCPNKQNCCKSTLVK